MFQPNRPWNSEINKVLERVFEAGLVQHFKTRHISHNVVLKAKSRQQKVSDSHTKFTLEHVFFGIVAIASGNGLAMMLFVMEKVKYKMAP